MRAVVDVKTRRVACVLLQAALGGETRVPSQFIDSEDWDTFPTDDMRMVDGTAEQWKQLGARLRTKRLGRKNGAA